MKNKFFNKVVGIVLSSSVILTGIISSPPAFAEESSSNQAQSSNNNSQQSDPIVYPKITSFSIIKEKSDTVSFSVKISEDLQTNNNTLYLYKKGDSNIVQEVSSSSNKTIELTIDRPKTNIVEYYVSVGDQRSKDLAVYPLENNDKWGLQATIDKTSFSTSDTVLPKISWTTKTYSNGKSIYLVDQDNNVIKKNGSGFGTSGEIYINTFFNDSKTFKLYIADYTSSSGIKLSQLNGVVASSNEMTVYTQPWNITGSVDLEEYSTNNPKLTFTSTLNQKVGGNIGNFLVEENSGNVVKQVSSSSSLTQKTEIAPKYLNEKNNYKFYVAKYSGTITNKNQFEEIKAESNIMKTKAQEWEIQLSSNSYVFYTEDKTPQLTVKANQPFGVGNSGKTLYLVDMNTNKIHYITPGGKTDSQNLNIRRFYTGSGKYKVIMSDFVFMGGNGFDINIEDLEQDIIAESNIITIERGPWEIYTNKIVTYDDNNKDGYKNVRVGWTQNQLQYDSNWSTDYGVEGRYHFYLYDKKDNKVVGWESLSAMGGSIYPRFTEGGIHKYGVVLAEPNSDYHNRTIYYDELKDIQAESDTITVKPSKWNVSISSIEEKNYNSSHNQTAITYVSNKTISSTGDYSVYFVNGVTGDVLSSTTSSARTAYVLVPKNYNGTYVIYVADRNGAKNVSQMTNIRAVSNSSYANELNGDSGINYERNTRFTGGGNPSSSDCDQNCYGDPVNSYNGELFENNEDLTIDGTSPLIFSRNYSTIKKDKLGAFGYGWDFNYNMRIEGESSNLSDSPYLSIIQENGSTVVFAKNDNEELGDEEYLVAPSMKVKLRHNEDDNTFEFERKDGTIFVFEENTGLLKSQKDRNNNRIEIERNSSHKITKIKNSDNSLINVEWNSDDLISSITDGIHTVDYSYNSNKELISVDNSIINNNKEYTYYSDHKIQKIIHPNEGVYETFYDSNNRVVKQIDPKNKETKFEYSGTSRIITLPDGTINKDIYSEKGLLTSRSLAFGTSDVTTYSYGYDSSNNLTYIKYPNGKTISYSYDSNGNLMFSKNSNGGVFRFSYNSNNLLTKTINPFGKISTNKYDSNGNIIESTDYNGKTTKFDNDSKGRLAKTQLPNDLETTKFTTYNYNSNGLVNKTIDTLGRESEVSYNNAKNMSKIIDPMDNEIKFEYFNNNAEMVKKITYENGSSDKNYYDDSNRLIKTIGTDGNAVEYTYDLMDNVTSVKNVYGTTFYEYDSNNRVISTTDPKNEKVEYEYNKLGLLTKTKYSNGSQFVNTYDKQGLLTDSTDAKGNKITYSYDASGNLLSIKDALGNTETYTYDILNQTLSHKTPKGSYTYYTYDDNGRVVSTKDSLNRITENKYDDNGNLIKEIYPNKTFSKYEYNSENILKKSIDRVGKYKEYTYDDNDRIIELNKNGKKLINYTYDKLDNVKKIKYDNEFSIDYEYDLAGKILSSQSSNDTRTNYSYDSIGNLTSRGPPNKETNYTYNNYGEITSIDYPSGKSINYEYNNFSQLSKVKSGSRTLAEYNYDSNFNNNSTTFGNGNVETYSFDYLNRVNNINVKNSDNASLYERQLEFDKDSYITNAKSLFKGSKTVDKTYTYKLSGTIDSVKNNLTSKTDNYTYDDFNNLTNLGSSSFNYENNYNLKSSSINSTNKNYEYDDLGNRVSSKVGNKENSYSWNIDGTLKNVNIDADTNDDNNPEKEIDYTYDNSGLLSSKKLNNELVDEYVWDSISSDVPVLLEDSSYDYIYGLDSTPFAQIDKDSGEIYYLTGDERNSVVLATDNSGNSVLTREYDEYGNLTQESTESVLNDDSGSSGESQTTEQENQNGSDNETADFNTNFGYAGEYLDKDTGLHNLRSRWFEPSTGSFLSVDPAFDLTNDAYGYASGNPVSFTDPLGLWSTGGALLTSAAAIVDGSIGLPVASGLMNSMSPGSVDNCSSLYKGLSIASGVGSMFIPGGGIIKGVGLGVAVSVKYGPKIAKGISKFVKNIKFSKKPFSVTAKEGLTTEQARKNILKSMKKAPQNGSSYIYLRTDPLTQKIYVGKSKSETSYKLRKDAHNKKLQKQVGDPLLEYDFIPIARPNGHKETKRTEEYFIRAGGGPSNKNNPYGVLENKIYASIDKIYQALGGDF